MFVIWTREEFNFVSNKIARVVTVWLNSLILLDRRNKRYFYFNGMERKDEIDLTGSLMSYFVSWFLLWFFVS